CEGRLSLNQRRGSSLRGFCGFLSRFLTAVTDDRGDFLLDELERTARLLDFFLGRSADSVDFDHQLLGELAGAEDLHAVPAALDQAALAERGLVDGRTGRKELEMLHVHFRELAGEERVEPDLRKASIERHLAALEVELVNIARLTRLLTL